MNITDEQQRAVDLVTSDDAPPLACLTGGPGTGKTTTLRALLDRASERGLRFECSAPSGKAAQRMAEATGRESQTLHRLMGLLPGSTDYSPIHADLLVVDEASMVDVPLMSCVLSAAIAGVVRTVLLVGDADQLPPVGPGQPFHDLLNGGVCPTVRLTQIHRQAQESGIVRAAHAINSRRVPDLDAPDLQLLECDELEQIPAACWSLIEEHGLDPDRSQILCPQRPNAGGVDAINAYVEESRRPVYPGEPLVRGWFRRGTKAINIRNDYTLGIFNGTLCEVLEAHDGEKKRADDELLVQTDQGERLTVRGGAVGNFRPAWALTVHRAQGSEWDDVIVVAHTAHQWMLTKRLLYVAVTRGAKRVWLVGQRKAIGKAVRNKRDELRDTWLGQRFARDRVRAAADAARGEIEDMAEEMV